MSARKQLTNEHKKHISEALGGITYPNRKPMTEEHKKNIRLSNLGKHNYKHTEETKKQLSLSHTGKKLSIEHKDNISKSMQGKGHRHSKETKRKLRMSKIKRIEQYGKVMPNFNVRACEFFKSFDEKNNTQGRYALYGDGEHYIESLGYFLDYFNPELKLIMEYDEARHFDINGHLKEKDIIREQEVRKYYPDYTFRRIKDEENIPVS